MYILGFYKKLTGGHFGQPHAYKLYFMVYNMYNLYKNLTDRGSEQVSLKRLFDHQLLTTERIPKYQFLSKGVDCHY